MAATKAVKTSRKTPYFWPEWSEKHRGWDRVGGVVDLIILFSLFSCHFGLRAPQVTQNCAVTAQAATTPRKKPSLWPEDYVKGPLGARECETNTGEETAKEGSPNSSYKWHKSQTYP